MKSHKPKNSYSMKIAETLATGDWTKGGEGRQPAKKLTAVKSMDTVNKH
jgi:hypothetical protein